MLIERDPVAEAPNTECHSGRFLVLTTRMTSSLSTANLAGHKVANTDSGEESRVFQPNPMLSPLC